MSHYVGLLVTDSREKTDIEYQLSFYHEQPEYCSDEVLEWEPYDEDVQEEVEREQQEEYPYPNREKRDGVWGYYYNPEAMFDWYVVGGRWRGLLHGKSILKKGDVNLDELDVIPYFIMSDKFTDQHVFAKGKMGWFGMSSDDYDNEEWEELFKHLWNNLDDDLWVIVLDFHI